MPLSARVSTSAVCFQSAEENVNSDEHFDRPFSFMAMKRKLREQKERDHLNNNPASTKKQPHT
jgi:hypothetical protein